MTAGVGVVGAGAWGTALAQMLASDGREVLLWAREAEVVAAINAEHRNPVFLPGAALSPSPPTRVTTRPDTPPPARAWIVASAASVSCVRCRVTTSWFAPVVARSSCAASASRCPTGPIRVAAATRAGPAWFGQRDRYGSVEAGKAADLVAVACNPLSDITCLERVRGVVKAGDPVPMP